MLDSWSMKKIFAIVVLGLIFPTNVALTKELLIECNGKYDGQQLTDHFLINISKKTWGNAKASKSKHEKIFIDDERFLRLYKMKKDQAWVCDMAASGICSVGYSELNRSTGEYTTAFFKMPRSVIYKEWYDKKPLYESEKKFHKRALDYLTSIKQAQYLDQYYKAKCKKTDKKF